MDLRKRLISRVSLLLAGFSLFLVFGSSISFADDPKTGSSVGVAPSLPSETMQTENASSNGESLGEAPKAQPKPSSKTSKPLPKSKPSGWRTITPAKAPIKKNSSVEVKPQVAQGATKPLSDFEVGKYQYCGDDRDCVAAVNGCCDCANGGQDIAVNKQRLEAFRDRFACLDVSCGEKEGNPACGSGVISCINHKCRYIAEPAVEEKF